MKTSTLETQPDFIYSTENLNLLNLEILSLGKAIRSNFPNFDYPTAKGGCRLKRQLGQLTTEIAELETDVIRSSRYTLELSINDVYDHTWLELYHEQLIMQERYHELYSFIKKFKSITIGLKSQSRADAVA